MAQVLLFGPEAERIGVLCSLLVENGFTAEGSTEADTVIGLGRKSRPEVLVVDLAPPAHLLFSRVASALRSDCPELKTIILIHPECGSSLPAPSNLTLERLAETPGDDGDLVRLIRLALPVDILSRRKRIGNCCFCGLTLPLLSPLPGDKGQSWACAFCGNRYHAVADPDASSEIKWNAQRDQRDLFPP